ncbi:ABC transporter permease subunit [Mesorhizobium sp. M0189]|uniref:ABC transporter permease subunit n=1 Tax=Mesorhizobium sp. M0189 TaxID=2956909 RepID=UPI0033386E14
MPTLRRLGRLPIGLGLPAFGLLMVVFGVPIVMMFLTSLNAPAFSLVNYEGFIKQPANLRVLFQTLEMSLVATAICVIIGYPTAYFISAAPRQVRSALIVLVVIPYLTSLLARTYAWIVILGDRGLINNLLLNHGFITSPLPLIYNRTAVYIGMVHIMLPVMILPLISVMLGIDGSLMAAARSMGARPFTAFWRVFLPLSLPGLRSGSLLVFVLCLGFYITPAALGGLRDAMLSTFIAAQVASAFNMARVAASAFVLLAIAILMLSIIGFDLTGNPGDLVSARSSRWNLRTLSASLARYLNELSVSNRAKRWRTQLYKAGGKSHARLIVGKVFVALVLIFLLFPGVVVIVMSFSDGAFLEFPPSGFSLQWYRAFFGDPSWNGALLTSMEIGVAVALISTVAGTLAAYGLSRTSSRIRSVLTLVMLTPITFPVIVVGIATYLGLVNMGLIGTKAGMVLAHSIGGIGYVVVIVSATLANFDRRLERAALSMRANPMQTLARVTLPLIMPGIIGGAVFAFIHSFDEVVISSLVSGLSIRTLPLKMWENMRHQIDPTIAAVSSLLVLLPVLWLIAIYVVWWRSKPSARGLAVPGTAA